MMFRFALILILALTFANDAFAGRYYSSDNGRFISRDAIGYVDGMNLYGAYFVPNYTDPTGNYKDYPDGGYGNEEKYCNPPGKKKKCKIKLEVWTIRFSLGIGKHGFITTECDGDKDTWELWQEPIPGVSLPGPGHTKKNPVHSLILNNAGLPTRIGGGDVKTTVVFEKEFTGCEKCKCIEEKSKAWAKDPSKPTQKGDYRLLGPNSNTYLVTAMRECVDANFSLPRGGIGGGSEFKDPLKVDRGGPKRSPRVK